ncbi:hypothetical protein EX349_22565 [Pseudomonas protegens]|nr:hypothetical protein [Pseudomonas protegens]NUE77140.1 hypothetical protein [Pseudomonas protegens]
MRLRWQASSCRAGGGCRSRLAREEAIEPCVDLAGAFAGKPASTGQVEVVGAGLPAKRPLNRAMTLRAPSLASQLLQGRERL